MTQPPHPGVPYMIVPDAMFRWGTDTTDSTVSTASALDHPSSDIISATDFPFPPPRHFRHGITGVPRRSMRAKELARTAQSTISKTTTTKPARHLIDRIAYSGKTLKKITHSRSLLRRLQEYAFGRDTGEDASDTSDQDIDEPRTTWDFADADTDGHRAAIPTAEHQSRAMHAIAAYYIAQGFRTPSAVNSEKVIELEFYHQIASFMAVWLQFRYDSNGLMNSRSQDWDFQDGPPRVVDDLQLQNGLREQITYPRWSSPVQKDHDVGIHSHGVLPSGKVNDADFLLYASVHEHPAFVEVKVWWIIGRDAVDDFFAFAEAANGDFAWGRSVQRTSQIGKFMHQLWAEFFTYGCRFGMFTNGQYAIFAIRTTDTQLTFSDWVEWTDPELYTTFCGFSIAASDTYLAGPPFIDPEDSEDEEPERSGPEWQAWNEAYNARTQELIDSLCPVDDRSIARYQSSDLGSDTSTTVSEASDLQSQNNNVFESWK